MVALTGFAVILAVMGIWTEHKWVLVTGVVVSGAFLGINNTLITEAVMKSAPVERPVASASYSFVRFSGGAVAPFLATSLGEKVSIHLPFYVGAGAVLVAALLLASQSRLLRGIDDEPGHGAEPVESAEEASIVTAGDAG